MYSTNTRRLPKYSYIPRGSTCTFSLSLALTVALALSTYECSSACGYTAVRALDGPARSSAPAVGGYITSERCCARGLHWYGNLRVCALVCLTVSLSPSGLAGKVVLVTGAGGGIGSRIALRFALAGGALALCDLRPDELRAAEEACRSVRRHSPIVCVCAACVRVCPVIS